MRKARTLNDIRNHPFVESVHTEYDGFREDDGPSYWVYLKPGYTSPDMGCGSIHEGTVKEACEKLNGARRCTIDEVLAGFVTTATLEDCQRSWAEVEGDTVLEATHLRGFEWAVRPEGQLGTCGWHPSPWEVVYVTATNARSAVAKVLRDRYNEAPAAA